MNWSRRLRFVRSAARWIIALALLYYAAVGRHREDAPETVTLADLSLPRAVPFEVSTHVNRAWLTDYRGVLALRASGLHVGFGGNSWGSPSASAPLVAVDSMGLGIAENSTAGFRIVAEQMVPYRIGPMDGPGVVSPPSTLSLSGVGKEDLVNRWPVIIHSVRIVFPGGPSYPEAPSAFREYTHLSRDVFLALLAPKPWETDQSSQQDNFGAALMALLHRWGPRQAGTDSSPEPDPPAAALPELTPITPGLFGGIDAEARIEADKWIRSVWADCYLGNAATGMELRPPPRTEKGKMYKAACYALSGQIDRARQIIDSLPESSRAPAAGILAWTAQPAAKAGDYAVGGPPMELVLEYWPTDYMAMFHAGAARFQAGDEEEARVFLNRFLAQERVPEPWGAKAREMLSRIGEP